MTTRVRTCLWYDGVGEQAASLYVSLLPNSRIENVMRPAPDAPVLLVDFTLDGVPYQALNGGPQFPHTEAASISVSCPDQAETDRLWNALTADGGSESMCGWLKDRYGLSWQIVPQALPRLLADPDREAADRVMQCMLGMRRIVVADLERAYRGEQ